MSYGSKAKTRSVSVTTKKFDRRSSTTSKSFTILQTITMSHSYFNALWRSAQDELDLTLLQEKELLESPPEKSRAVFTGKVAVLYLRYVRVVKQLDECYDQLTHPQKRQLIHATLPPIIARLLEIRSVLVTLDFSETPHLGDAMESLKLTPCDIELPIPGCTRLENDPALVQRRKLAQQIIDKIGRKEKQEIQPSLTLDEAIRVVQIHERARQGRLRAHLMRQIRIQETRRRNHTGVWKDVSLISPNTAALRIQSAWRSYKVRQDVRRQKTEEMIFIGMMAPPTINDEILRKANVVAEFRRKEQERRQREFEQDTLTLKERAKKNEGYAIMDRLQDEIRRWYMTFREQFGKFPDIPPEEEGGSKLITEKRTPRHSIDDASNPHLLPAHAVASKRKSATERPEKGDFRKKKEEEKFKGFEWTLSNTVETMEHGQKVYDETWRERREHRNWLQVHEEDLILAQVRREIELELRTEVDAAMRKELEALKAALDKDKGRKSKRGKKSGRRLGKKAKRKRKDKDLTPDRTLESLIEELAQCGILCAYPAESISNFLGECGILGYPQRRFKRDAFASLGEIRKFVTETCILPLSQSSLHEQVPLTKSVLLAGPRGAGKSLLVHAICHETQATLFNLSGNKLAGHYPGRAGLAMLLHLISKLSRLLQPAIILVEEAEKMFLKKAPRNERSEIRRLRKDFPKLVKAISPQDRVLVIGTTTSPWECDQKGLNQCYQRMIVIPAPDYASRFQIWQQLIVKAGVTYNPDLDLSVLARISDCYTAGAIARSVSEVITDRRKKQLSRQPLQTSEFVPALARCEPFYKEEEEQMRSWYAKTALRRKRFKSQKDEDEDELKEPQKKKKKGKKGKKGKKKVVSKKKGIGKNRR